MPRRTGVYTGLTLLEGGFKGGRLWKAGISLGLSLRRSLLG